MGMFDYIRCEVPLPDGFDHDGDLQTKDFDCEMVEHVITKGGRLLLDKGHYEDVPIAERKYPNAEPGTLESMCGIIRRVPRMEDANFHGEIYFNAGKSHKLDSKGWCDGKDLEVRYYKAKFTDGNLISIERIER